MSCFLNYLLRSTTGQYRIASYCRSWLLSLPPCCGVSAWRPSYILQKSLPLLALHRHPLRLPVSCQLSLYLLLGFCSYRPFCRHLFGGLRVICKAARTFVPLSYLSTSSLPRPQLSDDLGAQFQPLNSSSTSFLTRGTTAPTCPTTLLFLCVISLSRDQGKSLDASSKRALSSNSTQAARQDEL